MRAEGAPAAVTVARVMALGSGRLARTASSNQRSNCRIGSGSACDSDRPERMYSWRRSAIFMREILRGCVAQIRLPRGNGRDFPLKIVDTRMLIRHLLVTAARVAGEPGPKFKTYSVVQRRNRDGEEESEESGQEAQAECRFHEGDDAERPARVGGWLERNAAHRGDQENLGLHQA